MPTTTSRRPINKKHGRDNSKVVARATTATAHRRNRSSGSGSARGCCRCTIIASSKNQRRQSPSKIYCCYVLGCVVLLLFLVGVYIVGVLQGVAFIGQQQQASSLFLQARETDSSFQDHLAAADDDDVGENSVSDDAVDDDDSATVIGFIKKLSKLVSGRTRIRTNTSRNMNNPRTVYHEPVPVMYEDGPSKLKLPTPIINVGFPKAGTSSIFSFFHCNGLRSQHWYCCEEQNHPTSTEHRMLMSACMMENMISAKRRCSSKNDDSNDISSSLSAATTTTTTKTPLLFEGCGEYDVYTEINGPRNFIKYNKQTLLDDGSLLSPSLSSNERAQRIWFPQHFYLDEIHRQFPNATFILNQRHPVDEWVKSVMLWNNHLDFQILNEFYANNMTRHIFPDDFVAEQEKHQYTNNNKKKNKNEQTRHRSKPHLSNDSSESSNGPLFVFKYKNVREALRMAYHHHVEYVKEFVRKHPSHTLIEIDITSNETGKQLASSFGLHEECWGHFNQREGGRRKGRNGKRVAGGAVARRAHSHVSGSDGGVSDWTRNYLTKKYKLGENRRYDQEDSDELIRRGSSSSSIGTQGSASKKNQMSPTALLSLEEKRRHVRKRKEEQHLRMKHHRQRLVQQY